MAFNLPAQGSLYYRETAPAKWLQSFSPVTIDEGDSVTIKLRVANHQVGSRMILWATNNTGGGDLIGAGNWTKSWTTLYKEVLEKNGISVTVLSASTVPKILGQACVLAVVGPDYAGQEMTLVNTLRRNRRTERAPQRIAQILLQTNAGKQISGVSDPDVGGIIGSNVLYANDTSKSPVGNPSYTLAKSSLDGSVLKTKLNPGDTFITKVLTQNIIPGTEIKLYVANVAQDDVDFRPALFDVLRNNPPPGITFKSTPYPPPPGESWYKGYTAVYGDDYTDANPLTFPLTVLRANPDGQGYQFDVIANVAREGTVADLVKSTAKGDWNSTTIYAKGDWVNYLVDGGKYVVIEASSIKGEDPSQSSNWRPYIQTQVNAGSFSNIIIDLPPRYWEIRATTTGNQINYRIQCPLNALDDNVLLTSTNQPAGFVEALTAACQPGAPIEYRNGRLYAKGTIREACFVEFSVSRSGTGKHSLLLTDSQPGSLDREASYITVAETCVFMVSPVLPDDPIYATGVNIACAESSGGTNSVPGIYGNNYIYPARPERAAPADYMHMDYLIKLGVKIMRFPIKWDRVQRQLFGPLFGEKAPGAAFGNTAYDIARIDDVINYWTRDGRVCLLDIHNYSGYAGEKVGYDNPLNPTSALVDLWVKLAARYENNPLVWLGIMNEPNGNRQSPQRVRDVMHSVVNAIRSRTNSLSKILIPGCEYSSCGNWVTNGQAEAYDEFYDPANNFAFEPHCYFDDDASGTKGSCVVNSDNRLANITVWARSRGFKLFMGELAAGDPAIFGQTVCGTVLPTAFKYMANNKDVWIGWTAWGYGPYWKPEYFFMMSPSDYVTPSAPTPVMQMVLPYFTFQKQ